MSVARFIADQRTVLPGATRGVLRILGVSISWFYKWIDRRAHRPRAAARANSTPRC